MAALEDVGAGVVAGAPGDIGAGAATAGVGMGGDAAHGMPGVVGPT